MKSKFTPLLQCFLVLMLFGIGCKKRSEDVPDVLKEVNFREMIVPNGFNYSTTQLKNLNVKVGLLGGEAYEGAKFDVYLDNPHDYIGEPEELNKLRKVMSITLNKEGKYNTELKLPGYIEKIYLVSKSVGIPDYFELSASSTGFNLNYLPVNQEVTRSYSLMNKLSSVRGAVSAGNLGAQAIKSWSNVGFPDYLIDPIPVPAAFLNRISAALPRGQKVNTDFMGSGAPRTIVLDLKPGQTADVNITFLFANSANKNTLGYYWYPTNTPPASAAAIVNKGYIFPSTSRTTVTDYSGLVAGNTVKLTGPNADGSFPPNTSIGFFLIANGFTPSSTVGTPGTINTGRTTYYSNKNFNAAGTSGNMNGVKERMIAIYDQSTNKIVWSVEDGTDGDYSDVAFFATWNPNEAINTDEFPKVPTVPGQTPDIIYTPSANTKGTLLFEDSWPKLADFDMNDMVLNYRHAAKVDDFGQLVSEVNFSFDLVAVAAKQNNGFAVMIPNVAPGLVASISKLNFSGQNINTIQDITYSVEPGHTNDLVIKLFDGASTIMGGDCINNEGSGCAVGGTKTFSFTVKFTSPVKVSDFNNISPFIIPRGNRAFETHLANQRPSVKADTRYFGTDDDGSVPGQGKYYLSNAKNSVGNINWAVEVPEQIPYPKSGQSMTLAYPNFVEWAKSGNALKKDWYTNGTGNRVMSKLVNPPN